ncbi:CRISPR-associated endonuclease Cas1 [Cetobacterium ceti]|nr:CRISPR-associated endonuclease Cas1 [Cetobacterium ceti]
MEIFISQHGSVLFKRGELLVITNKQEKKEYSYRDISSILISGDVRLTTAFIKEAIENNIDIVLLDKYGFPQGRFFSTGLNNLSRVKKGQLICANSEVGIKLAKEWIIEKNIQIKKHLKELKQEDYLTEINIEKYQEKILNEEDLDIIRGYEGNISKKYFKILGLLMPKDFKFEKRSFRPALDEFNALLNYFLGILYNRIEKSCLIAGIDPTIGFFHRDDYNKPSFVFDYIEKYRYIPYGLTLKLFRGNKVRKSFFVNINNSYFLNEEGKRNLVPIFYDYLNKKVIFNNKKIEIINLIQEELFQLAKYFVTISKERR